MRAEAKPRNLGYTSDRLDFHTDLPYMHEQPGVQALLCQVQASGPGGDSLFADGFSAAEHIRRSRPDLFRLLTTVPVRFRDRGQLADRRFDLVATHATIELDCQPDGEWCYRRVHFSNQQRDLLQAWPLADVQLIYDALKAFNDVIEGRDISSDSSKVQLQVKLRSGEMALFDNSRLLHSRTGFSGERQLAGAYLLWDEVLSRRRTLESQLQIGRQD
ncbi:hypothetical protein BOX15_Mlig028201g1 [Macrostomum lignano]|uniref:TauD/TfdA-like domain-containing protein n=3 Tax=Macrostomum lignano TaxID=282301 RepID=A0A267FHY7_9PLAT|nr:hypothetical protein BOX15_Mlig028201g1 [Macrostomum lignano]